MWPVSFSSLRRARPRAGLIRSTSKKRRAHLGALDPRGGSAAGEGDASGVDGGHRLEALRLGLHVEEVLRRVDREEAPLPGLGQLGQTLGLLEGKRTQEHGADHAEDRAVGPDAEGEGGDRDEGEPRRLSQPAQSVDEVLAQSVHGARR